VTGIGQQLQQQVAQHNAGGRAAGEIDDGRGGSWSDAGGAKVELSAMSGHSDNVAQNLRQVGDAMGECDAQFGPATPQVSGDDA